MAKASRSKVQSRLEAEAGKFNASHRGTHIFKPIWETKVEGGCNWTTGFEVRGSKLPLSEMRAVLERVQAQLPIVDFDK